MKNVIISTSRMVKSIMLLAMLLLTSVVTRAAERQYTFDEIAFLDLTVRHKTTNELTTFEKLPAKFSHTGLLFHLIHYMKQWTEKQQTAD